MATDALWPHLLAAESRARQLAELSAAHELEVGELKAAFAACRRGGSKEPSAVLVPWTSGGGCAAQLEGRRESGGGIPEPAHAWEEGQLPGDEDPQRAEPPSVVVIAASCSMVSAPSSRGDRRTVTARSSASTWKLLDDEDLAKPEILPLWSSASAHSASNNSSSASRKGRTQIFQFNEAKAGDQVFDNGLLQGWVTYPTSVPRIVWDISSLLVVMYDLLTLPLVVFGYETLFFAAIADGLTTGFWSFDILFNFFVGFHRTDGRVEMRIKKIAARYLRTWLLVDVCVVLTDVTLMIADATASEALNIVRAGKTVRTVRITRCIRMLRLIRVIRLLQVFEDLCDVILSGPLATCLNIMKLLIGLAFIVHFIACAWYAVGLSGQDEAQMSWLSRLDDEGASLVYRYLIAYHWTMAQFTPAPNDLHPQNVRERLFAICVLFLGLVLFSSLLGSTTALLNQSKQMAYAKLREADHIRRFLADNHVSLRLGNKITHFFKGHQAKQSKLSESDLPSLRVLPLSLQIELHYEVYSQVLMKNAAFSKLEGVKQEALAEICQVAVVETRLLKGEEPFNYRMPGMSMIFLRGGHLDYYPGPATLFGVAPGSHAKNLAEGEWLSEPVLWVRWEHRGLLVAASPCSIVKVVGDQFRLAIQKHPIAFGCLKGYAIMFVRRMEEEVAMGAEVDDTFCAFGCSEAVLEQLDDDGKVTKESAILLKRNTVVATTSAAASAAAAAVAGTGSYMGRNFKKNASRTPAEVAIVPHSEESEPIS